MSREIRFVTSALEVRSLANGKAVINGYAAVFNKYSQNLGGFTEVVRPSAFNRTIDGGDIRSYFNHDKNLILGRTKSGTLRVSVDDAGLYYEVEPGTQSYARDLYEAVERGDVDGSSFGFNVVNDGEAWSYTESDFPLRELLEVRLYDVSPVSEPAYLDSTVSLDARSLEKLVEFRGWDASVIETHDLATVQQAALANDETALEARSDGEDSEQATEPETEDNTAEEGMSVQRARLILIEKGIAS